MLPDPAGGCGEIGIHAGFRCLWALRPWRFESSQPHSLRPLLVWAQWSLPLSSRGLGRRPLTAETGVRIPVAVLTEAPENPGFSHFCEHRRVGLPRLP